MTDITSWLERTYREVGRRPTPEGQARTLLLRHHYAARVLEVWDACTEPDRLKHWFRPVTGDLGIGGAFSFQGDAGGEILRCEPPNYLAVTWGYGEGPASEVIVRLAPGQDGRTALELEHAPIPDEIDMAGRIIDPILNDPLTGAFGLGTGWEMALFSLERYLSGRRPAAPAAREDTPEIRHFADRCATAWQSAIAEAAPRSRR